MIDMRIDVSGVLRQLGRAREGFVGTEYRGLLRQIGLRVRDLVRSRAPRRPGREQRPRWKKLRTSIGFRVRRDRVTVRTKNPKAWWFQYGTQAHTIRPRTRVVRTGARVIPTRSRALRIPVGGGYIYRRSVKHPGQPPRPFMPPATEIAEVAGDIVREHVARVLKASER